MRDVARRAHDSCLDCFAVLASYAPTGFLDHRDGLRASVANTPIALFNQVAVVDRPVAEDVAEDALREWSQRCPNLGVVVRQDVDDGVARAARRRGMAVVDAFPGMVAASVRAPRPPRGLELTVARGAEAVETHLDLMGRAFELTPDLLAAIFPPGLLDDPRVAVSIGQVEDQPVTTALGVMTGESVCLFNVATPPELRGRGYGAAVTAHAAAEGLRRGARLVVLQSSDAGFPVYRRLGFETVVDYQLWSAVDPG